MKSTVITIARQFGSRGREIGQKLAEELGYKYYDRDLISLAAEKSGMSRDILDAADEKAATSILYTLALGSSVYAHGVENINVPLNDKLYIVQSNIIKEIYERGEGAVIVGRCADYVLRDMPGVTNVFIYGEYEDRVKRAIEKYGDDPAKVKEKTNF